jgi:hypothetical protein
MIIDNIIEDYNKILNTNYKFKLQIKKEELIM